MTTPQGCATIYLAAKFRGYEFWARWDADAEVFEVFLSEQADDYILCATTLEDDTVICGTYIT